MNVVHEKVDAELPQSWNVVLNVDRIAINEPRDFGRGKETAWFDISKTKLFRRHIQNIITVRCSDTRDESYIRLEVLCKCFGVSNSEGIGMFVIEIDKVLGNFLSFLFISGEKGWLC